MVGINPASFHALPVTLLSLEEVNPIPAVKNLGLPSICLTPDACLECACLYEQTSSHLMENVMASILQTFVRVDNFTFCNPTEISQTTDDGHLSAAT